jgi:outer membrane assembly lipoprotein YfiO
MRLAMPGSTLAPDLFQITIPFMHIGRRMIFGLVLLLGLGAGVPMLLGAEAQSWEFRNGRWEQVSAQVAQATPDPALDQIEQLISVNQPNAARKLALQWLKTNKSSPNRDRALFLLAEAYFRLGDRIWSFYQYDELLDNYAESRLYYPALQRQYDIADAFLRGFKRKFLWMRILGAEEEAVEMLYRIQQRSPGSPIAEKALLRTADYYYSDGQYDLAADVYAAYARSYPRSSVIQTVRLRQAFSYYAQFRGVRFDPTPMTDARAQLVDLIKEYPEMARQENLPAFIERIDATFARKLYVTANYFERVHEPKAMAYYYQYLVKTYPNSPEADKARKILSELPAEDFVSEPLYPSAPKIQATTQPEGK